MTTLFYFRLLGSVQVERNGEPVQGFKSCKALALLGYLATENQPVSRAYLVELFWPGQSETRGRNNLSQTLHNLKALWPGCFKANRQSVQFRRMAAHGLDIREFNELVAKGEGEAQALAQAMDLYRGDFMAGMYLDDCPEFEQWLRLEQEVWRRRASQVLQDLIAHYDRCNELEPALKFASRLVAVEPYEEEGYRQKMRLLTRSGQRSTALAQYEACRSLLAEELDIEPARETVELYEQIRAGRLGQDTEAVDRRIEPRRLFLEPESSGAEVFNNLPAQSTVFVGRDTELAVIRKYLENPTRRLVTIVGLGGIGKTRLALQAAAALNSFQHGVCFIPLASTNSPEFIISTIADTLNFRIYGREDPKAQLLDYLSQKNMLLIMDNFEHLIEGANLLVEILQHAPHLKILVTSRERLGLPEEWVLDLQGLPYPDNELSGNLENYGAVQLFLYRARQARADFWLTFLDKPAIARICQLVEGLPLGLELAAAWTRTFSCQDIAFEIEKNYAFLTASLPSISKRHQSLQAVFEHSWQLLSDSEQRVFRKLSIFHKGFSRTSAEKVAGASPVLLSALVDKSLLRWTPAERYEMHELLRQYGAKKLAETPREKEKVLGRHCKYYAAFLNEQEAQLKHDNQTEALTRIGAEIDNIRIGWRWAITHLQVNEIEQYLEGLFLFYHIQSRFHEGAAIFGRAAVNLRKATGAMKSVPNHELKGLLGKVLARQSLFSASLGDYEKARTLMQESLAIFQDPDIRQQVSQSLNYLGVTALMLGEPRQAKELCQESLKISQAAKDGWKEATALGYLGLISMSLGEYIEARELAQRSLVLFRDLGFRSGIACSLNILGLAARILGQYTEAKQFCQESLIIAREIGDRWAEALSLEYLGKIALSLGEYLEAKELAQKSLAIFRGFDYSSEVISTLNLLGKATRKLGQYKEARKLHEQVLQTCQDQNYKLGMAYASFQLGYTAYLLSNYVEANRLLADSLALSQKLTYQRGVTRSLNILGRIACELGNHVKAKQYLHQALKITQDIRAVPLALEVLTGLANCLIKESRPVKAIELLTIALYHPASEQEIRDEAGRLLAQTAAKLPETVVIMAREKGLSYNLDDVLTELFSEPVEPAWQLVY